LTYTNPMKGNAVSEQFPSDTNESLAAQINEAHELAMQHAGTALDCAITCGQLLLEAKATIPHGHWLPWLRANVAFSERSVQGYMRVARRLPNPQRVADLPLRHILKELRTPLRSRPGALDADLEAWTAENRAARKPTEHWTVDDARACVERIRAFDEIMHRYGICPDVDDPEPTCLICSTRSAPLPQNLGEVPPGDAG
jgi:hypothetical protein